VLVSFVLINNDVDQIYGEEGSPGTQQAGPGRVNVSPSPTATSQPVPKAASISSTPKAPVQTAPTYTVKKTDDWGSGFDDEDHPKSSSVSSIFIFSFRYVN